VPETAAGLIPAQWVGLLWLLGTLAPFVLAQRWLHREIQTIFFILTRRPPVALGLFALLFFPGVVLHEASHWLAAMLLRVRVGRVSLMPRVISKDKLQLGFVEVAATDPLRGALIGAAPLISGGALVAWLAVSRLGVLDLTGAAAAGDWALFWQQLSGLPSRPDFWLWFYLAFAVSSTMLPSASDRKPWLPVILTVGALAAAALLLGAGPWLAQNLAPRLDVVLRAVALVFGISLGVHLVLLLPLIMLRALLMRVVFARRAD